MTLMNKEQYIASLRMLKLNVYMFGKKIQNPVDNPIIIPSMNAVAATYELALNHPEFEDLMTAT
ncbi:MAG: 4-hydroxybutyryl-CoA dehydratase/vinylacetyl-CoA-Delta-isomerase [Clostridium sp.]|jgi:4-hydroxybutyryl-CoA dehydratase/vinylacetyl-CoA-Delta-isomerase